MREEKAYKERIDVGNYFVAIMYYPLIILIFVKGLLFYSHN
jgi:hypothetical protein